MIRWSSTPDQKDYISKKQPIAHGKCTEDAAALRLHLKMGRIVQIYVESLGTKNQLFEKSFSFQINKTIKF